jgi:hypothetical protein
MRRLSTTLLTACALALTACGDDEENVGSGSQGDHRRHHRGRRGPAADRLGLPTVDEPRPKKAGKLKRPKLTIDEDKAYTAVLKTNCGTVTIRLAAGRSPKTVNSFVKLARDGFYDGLGFHRIVPDFVAQAGDPQGDGEGGPGYEVVEAPPEASSTPAASSPWPRPSSTSPAPPAASSSSSPAPDAGPARRVRAARQRQGQQGDARQDRQGPQRPRRQPAPRAGRHPDITISES